MNLNLKNIARWMSIFSSIGMGVWMLISSTIAVTSGSQHSYWITILAIFFSAALSSVPLLIGYLIFRRMYYEMYSILTAIGVLVVYGSVYPLMQWVGILGPFQKFMFDHPWSALIGLPLSVIIMVAPLMIAARFLNLANRLQSKFSQR
jgi:hypothetical protein